MAATLHIVDTNSELVQRSNPLLLEEVAVGLRPPVHQPSMHNLISYELLVKQTRSNIYIFNSLMLTSRMKGGYITPTSLSVGTLDANLEGVLLRMSPRELETLKTQY